MRGSAKVLARRVQSYDPEALDNLCLPCVGWGRLSASGTLDSSRPERVVLSNECCTHHIFIRDEADWMTSKWGGEPTAKIRRLPTVGPSCETGAEYLSTRGASFSPILSAE